MQAVPVGQDDGQAGQDQRHIGNQQTLAEVVGAVFGLFAVVPAD